MSVYSIKDLEHVSGVKAHTIRIWEQRYNLFSPQRTPTNIRYYSDDDLKLIINISTLRNHGFKISKIVAMSSNTIQEEVLRVTAHHQSIEDHISALTIAMIEMDEILFNSLIDQYTKNMGFEGTMMKIVYPFMRKIGVLWLTNSINPAQEHFISHLVKQKLIVATDAIQMDTEAPLYLLYLPEGELHELGLLFANYLLRQKGVRTIFFGQSVPLEAMEEVYHKLNPKYILVSLTTTPESNRVQAYLHKLSYKFRDATILVTGYRVIGQTLEIPFNMKVIESFEELTIWADHKLSTKS